MAIFNVLEVELNGRGGGWTDISADLADSNIEAERGMSGNGVADHVASSGPAKFELINEGPRGQYSIQHANRTSGWALGIGVRLRLVTQKSQGTGTGYLVNNVGGYPSGTTVFNVDTGTGSIFVNDVVFIVGSTLPHIVTAGGAPDSLMKLAPLRASSVPMPEFLNAAMNRAAKKTSTR